MYKSIKKLKKGPEPYRPTTDWAPEQGQAN